MKTLFPSPPLERNRATLVLVAVLALGGTAHAAEPDARRDAGAAIATTEKPPSPAPKEKATPAETSGQPRPEPLAPDVNAVIRMADAGISTAVMRTYVESSTSAHVLTAGEIIALKQHNVADEIVNALLSHGTKLRGLAAQERRETQARAAQNREWRTGGLDPESYEYFQHYYLQPRALASAQERLNPSFGRDGYYYSPYGLSPGYRFRFHRGHRR